MKIKDRLHWSYSLVNILVLTITGGLIFLTIQARITAKMERELTQTNLLVFKMVENVFDINQSLLLRNLGIMEDMIRDVAVDRNTPVESDAEHYITQLTDYISISSLYINGEPVFDSSRLVDEVAVLTGGFVSILQLVPHGLLRISTTISRPDGSRATQVYYPPDHPLTKAIRKGDLYLDKTFESGEWQITAASPLVFNGFPVGAVLVGITPEIRELRKHILNTVIGETGVPFIVDTEGIMIISEDRENENVFHLPHIKKMITERKNGLLVFRDYNRRVFRRKRILAYHFLPRMNWIIASGSFLDEFYYDLRYITVIIIVSIAIALFISLIVSRSLAEKLAHPLGILTSGMNDLQQIKYDFSNFSRIDRIRRQLGLINVREEEITLMAETFSKMLEELEDAQKQMISRHRRFRESELVRRVDEFLIPDSEQLGGKDRAGRTSGNEADGSYFDKSTGTDGLDWYLVGHMGADSELGDLFMMLAQTSLTSLLTSLPDATPAELVRFLNSSLIKEINNTLPKPVGYLISLLIRSESGWITYAGPLSRLFLFRKKGLFSEAVSTVRYTPSDSDTFPVYEVTCKLPQRSVLCLGFSDEEAEPENLKKSGMLIHETWDDDLKQTIHLLNKSEAGSGNSRDKGLFLLRMK